MRKMRRGGGGRAGGGEGSERGTCRSKGDQSNVIIMGMIIT